MLMGVLKFLVRSGTGYLGPVLELQTAIPQGVFGKTWVQKRVPLSRQCGYNPLTFAQKSWGFKDSGTEVYSRYEG